MAFVSRYNKINMYFRGIKIMKEVISKILYKTQSMP